MATGLIGTLTALVLGLLIASAKKFVRSEDQPGQANDRDHNPSGRSAHAIWSGSKLICGTCCGRAFSRWPIVSGMRNRFRPAVPFGSNRAPSRWAFENELERLSPANDTQRSLQSRAIQAFTEGAQIRLQLFAQTGGSIPVPFLVILVFWLSAIFVSFTLFARTNLIVMTALFVCALSVCPGAIFLVLEPGITPSRG